MANDDVVKHDLDKATLTQEELRDSEPFPLPTHRPPQRPAVTQAPVTTRVTDLTVAPYCSVGKFSVRTASGGVKSATAWVVARRALITAGHCVYRHDYGGWITQALFCPRYDETCSQLFEVTAVYTLQGWIDLGAEGGRQYDLAACVLKDDISAVAAPLPVAIGGLPPLSFMAVGYPIKPIPGFSFNGKRMWQSTGGLIRASDGVIWAENNLTNGASGGPWCDPDDNNVVSGISSCRDDDPNSACSPVLGQGFQNLYNAVKDL